mmetsp:Transcript_22155/g.42267  ORF Transcript_22155/g.42267 Transcript_22155/m.42267 type:complete len:95 (-) Transcript_22155:1382-1666(-)
MPPTTCLEMLRRRHRLRFAIAVAIVAAGVQGHRRFLNLIVTNCLMILSLMNPTWHGCLPGQLLNPGTYQHMRRLLWFRGCIQPSTELELCALWL